jgi:NTE family protein
MARVGLVLGGGGLVGQAYHSGVLAALELDLGWDPRSADVIVGSSAGALTGAALRLGVPASDLAARVFDAPLTGDGAVVIQALTGDGVALPPFRRRDVLRPWRLPSRALCGRAVRRPWAFRPMTAASTLVPTGRVELAGYLRLVDDLAGGVWPEGLWICVVRRDDARRVVIGRPGGPTATLSDAVAASCALPGYLAPVTIAGVPCIDGGVHSPTNADVLRREQLDVVVVVSPMSAAHGHARTPDAAMRWANHHRLERELRRLRAAGTQVVRFEPGPRVLAVMGRNLLDAERAGPVVREAFLDGGEYAATSRVARRLATIASRPSRRAA